jgi:DNA replication licensing factor MCM6
VSYLRASADRLAFVMCDRYVALARSYHPKITSEAKKTIVQCYRSLRQADVVGSSQTAYRITVRQLESMIRLSEALARLHLDAEVKPMYVQEAYRLLQQSIIRVESQDVVLRVNEDEVKEGEDGELHISFTKYQRIQSMLARYLRHLEDESAEPGKGAHAVAVFLFGPVFLCLMC